MRAADGHVAAVAAMEDRVLAGDHELAVAERRVDLEGPAERDPSALERRIDAARIDDPEVAARDLVGRAGADPPPQRARHEDEDAEDSLDEDEHHGGSTGQETTSAEERQRPLGARGCHGRATRERTRGRTRPATRTSALLHSDAMHLILGKREHWVDR
ncbi:MAG: hypothetical protein R3B09_10745 [Nannocystaceae bacterium]